MTGAGTGFRTGAHGRPYGAGAGGRLPDRGRRAGWSLTVAVVDAAAVVDLICGFPAGDRYRDTLQDATVVATPAHLDAEVLSALGRLRRAGQLSRPQERLEALAAFGARRWPLRPLLVPAWALLDRIAARDALYVALAASLDAMLITIDARLRRAAKDLVAVAE
jgi:predicted nucleic acid-binding protein